MLILGMQILRISSVNVSQANPWASKKSNPDLSMHKYMDSMSYVFPYRGKKMDPI